MNHSQYLQWCQERALDYVTRGELISAVTSLLSDLSMHNDWTETTFLDVVAEDGMNKALAGDRRGVVAWILGFDKPEDK